MNSLILNVQAYNSANTIVLTSIEKKTKIFENVC